jgi:hypothetical protein
MDRQEAIDKIINEYNKAHDPISGKYISSGNTKQELTPLERTAAVLARPSVIKRDINPNFISKESERTIPKLRQYRELNPVSKESQTIASMPLKYEGIKRDLLRGGSYEGYPKDFHTYRVGNTVTIHIDSDITNHKAIANKIHDSLKYIPKQDTDKINGLSIVTSKKPVRADSFENTSKTAGRVMAGCDLQNKNISLYQDSVNSKVLTGIIIHEVGHMALPTPFKPFRKEFDKDGLAVTNYGNKSRPVEAFAEAYAKYHITGKVTAAGGSYVMTNTNEWFNKTYGKPAVIGGSDLLLNEKISKWTDGKLTIIRYLDSKGNLTKEVFAEKK